jgi:hypothetical protein
MPSSEAPETYESVVEPGEGGAPLRNEAREGVNGGVLLVFVAIVALIAAQNLWLRRRARRERS